MDGQIAHIDRNHSNASLDNGAYLCKGHHDKYDSRPSQSKRLTPDELRKARADLHEFVQLGGIPEGTVTRRSIRRGVALSVYERRLPIYKATVEFIRYVMGDLNPSYQRIIEFGRSTEEALFLYDGQIAQYLADISSKAVRVHATAEMIKAATHGHRVGDFESLVRENTSLAEWFTQQYDVTRAKMAPFLRLE